MLYEWIYIPNSLLILAIVPFILTIFLFIFLYLLGVPLLPHSFLGGTVLRVPHFALNTTIKPINSLPRQWKKKQIKRAIMEGNKNLIIKYITGEFFDSETIEYAISNGIKAEVICGPKLGSQKIKHELLSLLIHDNLNIFIMQERPPRHVYVIGRNFFLEDPHEPLIPYDSAIIIEDAKDEILTYFNIKFSNMKERCVKANKEVIEKMEVY